MMEDELEQLRLCNPAAYQDLLDSLPDVRDGLNRRQRTILTTMHKLGLTHDRPRKNAGYVVLNTPPAADATLTEMKLRRVRFSDGQDSELPEPEHYYTPDLELEFPE